MLSELFGGGGAPWWGRWRGRGRWGSVCAVKWQGNAQAGREGSGWGSGRTVQRSPRSSVPSKALNKTQRRRRGES
eukprot:scaffold1589_cov111-Isochrysis_galbana.AAC.12